MAFLAQFRPGLEQAKVRELCVRACFFCERPPRKGRSSIEVTALLKAMQEAKGVLEPVSLESIVARDAFAQLYEESEQETSAPV